MHRNITRSLMLGTLAVLTAGPVSAQVHADLGPLHIRIATEGPPPIRVERRPVSPGRDYVWIGGYWDRRDDRWEWIGGRWDRPADRHYSWVRARYAREGKAWRYEPGHWSNERLNDEEYRRWRDENARHRD